MSKQILQIVATAYRATLEEQDDPVLWLTESLRGNGLKPDVLLRGNAVNYLVRDQEAGGLQFGERRQTQPPRLAEDVTKLLGNGVRVYYVEDDARTRGIKQNEIIGGAQPVAFDAVTQLLEQYEQVWHW